MKKSILFLFVAFLSAQISIAQNAITVKKISSKGNPVILLPHIGCSSAMWNDVANQLSKENSVYLVDLAGFNSKEALKDDFTNNYVIAIEKFIKKEKLKNITFIGQNYGAFLAVKIANTIPDKMKAVVASDFFPKLSMVLGDLDQEKIDQFSKSILQMAMDSDEATFTNNQKQIALSMNFIDTTYVDEFVKWQVNSDRNTLARTLIEQLNGNLIPIFENNKVPTLVFNTWFFAKEFQKLPIEESEERMNAMYPNAKNVTHKVTEDAKDFIANDQPEWFLQNVNEFLNTI